MTKAGPGSRRGGGPRLDSDEWAVLLDIYLRHRGAPLGVTHPELQAASRHLSLRARGKGRAREGAELRSAHGLARRLTVLRAIERGDTVGAPREAVLTWQRYGADPQGCADFVASFGWWRSNEPVGSPRPSRGPTPFAGQYVVEQHEGAATVYVMMLRGALLARKKNYLLKPFVKIGRSSDPVRREGELNFAFPPGLGLSWVCIFQQSFPSGDMAHEAEQSVLAGLADLGLCIGGEFVRCSPEEVVRAVKSETKRLERKSLPATACDASKAADGASRERYDCT